MSAVLRPSRSSFRTRITSPFSTFCCSVLRPGRSERTSTHLVSEDAVRFHASFLQNANLTVQGLATGGNAGVAEQSHALELSIKSIYGRVCVYYICFKDLINA